MLPFAKPVYEDGKTATDCSNLSSLSQLSSLLSTGPELTTHANPWLLVYSPSSPNLHVKGVDSPLHIVMLPIPQINSELIIFGFLLKVPFREVLLPGTRQLDPDDHVFAAEQAAMCRLSQSGDF